MTRALLDAILAAPADDAPRLVYADWLLERGDVRGDFILAQCTLAACEAAGDLTSDVHREAWRRSYLHGRDHAKQLAAAYEIPDLTDVVYERGLPIIATMALEHEPAVSLARLPFRRLSLGSPRPPVLGDLRRVFDGLLPASLSLLTLRGPQYSMTLDAALVRDVLGSMQAADDWPLWTDERELPNPPFDTTMRGYYGPPLTTARLPPTLRDLVVYGRGGVPFPVEGWSELVDLQGAAIYFDEDAEAIAALRALPFARLQDLSLVASSDYGPEVSQAFAENAARASKLAALEVSFPIDGEVARSLERSPLGLVRATAGGTVEAHTALLERHALHTFELWRLPEAVSLLTERAPPTLAHLALEQVALGEGERARLLDAERLARVPLIRVDDELVRAPSWG